jgi:organic radical activating enzyme
MKQKLFLNYAEFYITNVCNLNCTGCNRFNSFAFKGWNSWRDYESVYQQWSEQLNIGDISIMGGEPLLNPEFDLWVSGLRKLWPQAGLAIASNGTQLHKHKNFYQTLLQDPGLKINVSLHNKQHKAVMLQHVKDFLTAPFTYSFDNMPYNQSLTITDSNNISIKIMYNWWFHQGAVVAGPEPGQHTLHQSNPEVAHSICHSKTCHHFENGRLYKCGPAALFPEFDRQIGLTLSDNDRELINSVASLGLEHSKEQKQQFLAQIDQPIPQCKFCPESYQGQQIFAQEKKSVLFRR